MEWKPIESAPDFERVLVCGWQPRSRSVRGYWWWHEDVCEHGRSIQHPNATHWAPIIKPDFPTPPETNP